MKHGDFTTDQHNVIKDSLDEMSGYLNGCIEFYDDTETQDKSPELFVTRSSTSKVPKFWSFIDFYQRSTRTSTS